jgi:ferredoxin
MRRPSFRAPGSAGRVSPIPQDGERSDMTFVPTIDPNACSAHGDCVDIAPNAFAMEDDGAVVIGTASYQDLVRAAKGCPAVAITVVDDETGEQVYP